ncbi:uncharacterized protein LOC111332333 [Stylophora pistillata]|nr:uncharacterized protein LOC111332333 [Stylophora pistillata]
MSAVRRKLFREGSNTWAPDQTIAQRPTNEAVENDRTEIVEYTVVNEGDVVLKEPSVETPHGLKTPQENVFRPTTPSCYEKDREKKLLIIHEADDETVRKGWAGKQTLEGIQVVTCQCANLISVCTKETFLVIFLDISSVTGNAQKIFSTIR